MTHGGEHGQATVEFAVLLPLFALMLMVIVQAGGVLLDDLAVTQAAREGARAAAVDPDPGAAAAAARKATGLDPLRLDVEVGSRSAPDGLVHVRVRYETTVVVPLTRRVIARPVLEGTAAMRVEGSGPLLRQTVR